MTLEPEGQQPASAQEPDSARQPEAFSEEIRAAVRYERGLVVKALAVLAMLAVLIVLRELFFT
jgi:hypothetical protein